MVSLVAIQVGKVVLYTMWQLWQIRLINKGQDASLMSFSSQNDTMQQSTMINSVAREPIKDKRFLRQRRRIIRSAKRACEQDGYQNEDEKQALLGDGQDLEGCSGKQHYISPLKRDKSRNKSYTRTSR